jgi:hypothetical protein
MGRQLTPVICRGESPVWQTGESIVNSRKRNPEPLCGFDDRYAAQCVARVTALVPVIPGALDQPFCFVEMQRGNSHARPFGDLANTDFSRQFIPSGLRHIFSLDLK